MLQVNIIHILEEKGIKSKHAWLTKAGISSGSATKLLNNQFRRYIPFTVLETLCHRLHCTPNDLFTWQPSTTDHTPPNHPLRQLTPVAGEPPIAHTLQTLTPAQIKKLKESISNITQQQ